MYGAQTPIKILVKSRMFENDVEMYGAQTSVSYFKLSISLRMM